VETVFVNTVSTQYLRLNSAPPTMSNPCGEVMSDIT